MPKEGPGCLAVFLGRSVKSRPIVTERMLCGALFCFKVYLLQWRSPLLFFCRCYFFAQAPLRPGRALAHGGGLQYVKELQDRRRRRDGNGRQEVFTSAVRAQAAGGVHAVRFEPQRGHGT